MVAIRMLAACTGLLAVGAVAVAQHAGEPATTLTVKAGTVTQVSPHVLTGTFEIRAPQTGEASVQSDGRGGACLLAQVPTQAKSCTASRQCQIAQGPGEPKWVGYCLSGKCWMRPSESYCMKGVEAGPHTFPQVPVDADPVYRYVAAHDGGAGPIFWQVVACVNGVGPNSKTPQPCAGGPGEVMHDEGTPVELP